MYYLKGINSIINMVCQQIKWNQSAYGVIDADLIHSYNNYLREKSIFANYELSDKILITDFFNFSANISDYYDSKRNYFDKNSKILCGRLINGFFNNALNRLKLKSQEIYSLANLIIKVIVVNRMSSYLNGTNSNSIGLCLLDFKDEYDEHDFIELVVHQLTHMILYLDDQVTRQMSEEVNKNILVETGLKYIHGGTFFPLYLAFHNYIVGVEILCFRRQINGLMNSNKCHGDTKKIIKNCNAFKNSLMDNYNLFTKHGQIIIDDYSMLLNEFKNFG